MAVYSFGAQGPYPNCRGHTRFQNTQRHHPPPQRLPTHRHVRVRGRNTLPGDRAHQPDA